MELRGKKILLLGGYGLVGFEVARQALQFEPEEIVLLSLKKEEVEDAKRRLEEEGTGRTRISLEFGNLFTRTEYKDLPPSEVQRDSRLRQVFLHDIWHELDEEILEHSFLYHVITKHRPHIVVDCVNTATAISYQNVYSTSSELAQAVEQAKALLAKGEASREALVEALGKLQERAETCLSSLYIPQLVRHVQILYRALSDGGVQSYVKVGTSGTGGMGLNIPYTHGEERPSRVLLSKTAVAGAHTLLLFLLARTPHAPMVKEIKPAAAIAWRAIEYGEVKKGAREVRLFNVPKRSSMPSRLRLRYTPEDPEWHQFTEGEELPPLLQSVYIDTGENGLFSRSEFEVITFLNQMEFVTPEEIARNILLEIQGKNTGRDVVAALDSSCMGPTYRAGYLRAAALEYMRELEEKHNCASVAFEMLGPPRISKLLFEAHLLSRCYSSLQEAAEAEPEEMSRQLEALLEGDPQLSAQILAIGLPVLFPDGTFLRGPEIKIPPERGEREVEVTPEELERWVEDGWVDLRPSNMAHWKERLRQICAEIQSRIKKGTASAIERGKMWGLEQGRWEIGEIVGWILSEEDQGSRTKR